MIAYAKRAGVLGATGYTGRELVRLLARHPRLAIAVATSQSEAGRPLGALVAGAPGIELARLEDAALADCDVVFSCLPHGESAAWVERARAAGARVVDLSSDLRVAGAGAPAWAAGAAYGLPELFRAELAGAQLVANPGCYPTAVLVALAPLLRRGLVAGPVVVNAASGVTGAGRSPRRDLLFGEVAEDFRAYGVGNGHRHLAEMRVHGGRLGGVEPELVFTPHLLPVRRGILETMYVPLVQALTPEQAVALWSEHYAGEVFIDVCDGELPTLRRVLHRNIVSIGFSSVSDVERPMLIVVVAFDNLVKGAAGQALQNANLMLGFDEAMGLPR